jgi:hypothetical protein
MNRKRLFATTVTIGALIPLANACSDENGRRIWDEDYNRPVATQAPAAAPGAEAATTALASTVAPVETVASTIAPPATVIVNTEVTQGEETSNKDEIEVVPISEYFFDSNLTMVNAGGFLESVIRTCANPEETNSVHLAQVNRVIDDHFGFDTKSMLHGMDLYLEGINDSAREGWGDGRFRANAGFVTGIIGCFEVDTSLDTLFSRQNFTLQALFKQLYNITP